MRRFVETNRGEAVGEGGFRAFGPNGRTFESKPIAFVVGKMIYSKTRG